MGSRWILMRRNERWNCSLITSFRPAKHSWLARKNDHLSLRGIVWLAQFPMSSNAFTKRLSSITWNLPIGKHHDERARSFTETYKTLIGSDLSRFLTTSR